MGINKSIEKAINVIAKVLVETNVSGLALH